MCALLAAAGEATGKLFDREFVLTKLIRHNTMQLYLIQMERRHTMRKGFLGVVNMGVMLGVEAETIFGVDAADKHEEPLCGANCLFCYARAHQAKEGYRYEAGCLSFTRRCPS